MTAEILSIHHASVLVADIRRALQFYRDILGLEADPLRPELGYPGAWLAVGKQQIHLLELPNPDPVRDRPAHGGHDRHIALQIRGIKSLEAILKSAEISYTSSKSGRSALFFRDPDGNSLECFESP